MGPAPELTAATGEAKLGEDSGRAGLGQNTTAHPVPKADTHPPLLAQCSAYFPETAQYRQSYLNGRLRRC